MAILSDSLQNMANTYPSWSRVRNDPQSIGQRILNCFGIQFDNFNKKCVRTGKNVHLCTANLKEMDWLYKISLGQNFDFNENTEDPFYVTYDTPTVSGQINGQWHVISLADENNIENFWYEHIPDRIDVGATSSGLYVLMSDDADNTPFSGIISPHEDGYLYIQVSGGTNYITVTDGAIERAKVVINGTTRQGIEESETLVFPWDQKQRTTKEWNEIDTIDCINFPENVTISVYSADVANGPYLDFWNLRYSLHRNKIDSFWDISDGSYGSTLDLVQYSTDEVASLIAGTYCLYEERQFELLDGSRDNITVIDIAQEPFTDRIWAVTASGLYCYDSRLTITETTDHLKEITTGTFIQIDPDSDFSIRGESAKINFRIRAAAVPVTKYKCWVEYPDETVSGILHGSLVDYSTLGYTTLSEINEFIDQQLIFDSDQLGEHLFTLSAIMSDGTTQVDKRIITFDYKEPLAEFDLPTTISGVIGIDFDSEQNLWVYTSYNEYHRIDFHHDVMLIDWANKEIYVREPYTTVAVSAT